MSTENTVDQAFQRLDDLKREIEALARESLKFEQVAVALKDPLNWRLGGESILGYGDRSAEIDLPDVRALAQRQLDVKREHHDLLFNTSRGIEGSAKEFFATELGSMKR